MVTPAAIHRLVRRAKGVLASATPEGPPAEIWLPDNGDGRGPGRYPIGGGPGVIVILADDDPRWDTPTPRALGPEPPCTP